MFAWLVKTLARRLSPLITTMTNVMGYLDESDASRRATLGFCFSEAYEG